MVGCRAGGGEGREGVGMFGVMGVGRTGGVDTGFENACMVFIEERLID